MRRLFFAILILLFSVALIAGDKKNETSHSAVSFTVLKDETGKPVRNAAVILHSLEAGKQSRGGFELKTNNDGKTHFDGVPYGALRVQVIARGFQTYGEDVNIAQAEQEVTIRLKRPQEQYSIYEKSGSAPAPEKKQ